MGKKQDALPVCPCFLWNWNSFCTERRTILNTIVGKTLVMFGVVYRLVYILHLLHGGTHCLPSTETVTSGPISMSDGGALFISRGLWTQHLDEKEVCFRKGVAWHCFPGCPKRVRQKIETIYFLRSRFDDSGWECAAVWCSPVTSLLSMNSAAAFLFVHSKECSGLTSAMLVLFHLRRQTRSPSKLHRSGSAYWRKFWCWKRTQLHW